MTSAVASQPAAATTAVRETVAGTNHLLIAERPTTVGALLEAFWRAA